MNTSCVVLTPSLGDFWRVGMEGPPPLWENDFASRGHGDSWNCPRPAREFPDARRTQGEPDGWIGVRHYRRQGERGLTRRLFLFGSAAASVAGAALITDTSEPTGRPTQPADGAEEHVPGSQVVKAAAAGIPGKDDIVAEFSGRKPVLWGLQVPGTVVSLPAGSGGTLLTFDCCGGPGGNGVDQALIDSLSRAGAPAIFFLNARWVRANPGPAKSLAENPLFEIGNHGTRHVPLSLTGRSAYGIRGTASPAEVYDEVMTNQEVLHSLTGGSSRFFRPGTAFFDEVAVAIVRRLGLVPMSFSVNGDGGATYPADTVFSEVNAAKSGDVIIAHANHPGGGTAGGITRAIPALRSSGRAPAVAGDKNSGW
jgi:peptidoglycan/xylan/chitin deacetylase (PgdA/CDA1 family)